MRVHAWDCRSEDVRTVMRDPWLRTVEEFRRYGIHDAALRLRVAESILADSVRAWAFGRSAGVPIACAGATPAGGEGLFETWFMASPEIEQSFAPVTIKLRNLLQQAVTDYRVEHGRVTLRAFTCPANDKVRSWYRALGFEPVGDDPDFSVFELRGG